jgi:hypothetical protein
MGVELEGRRNPSRWGLRCLPPHSGQSAVQESPHLPTLRARACVGCIRARPGGRHLGKLRVRGRVQRGQLLAPGPGSVSGGGGPGVGRPGRGPGGRRGPAAHQRGAHFLGGGQHVQGRSVGQCCQRGAPAVLLRARAHVGTVLGSEPHPQRPRVFAGRQGHRGGRLAGNRSGTSQDWSARGKGRGHGAGARAGRVLRLRCGLHALGGGEGGTHDLAGVCVLGVRVRSARGRYLGTQAAATGFRGGHGVRRKSLSGSLPPLTRGFSIPMGVAGVDDDADIELLSYEGLASGQGGELRVAVRCVQQTPVPPPTHTRALELLRRTAGFAWYQLAAFWSSSQRQTSLVTRGRTPGCPPVLAHSSLPLFLPACEYA